MKIKKSRILLLGVALILLFVGVKFYEEDPTVPKFKIANPVGQEEENGIVEKVLPTEEPIKDELESPLQLTILELTNEDVVIDYVRKHKKLPEYYITKRQARERGWIAAKGNLCDVLPDKAIGGDRFGNYESRLPKRSGRQYFEADINYNCGRRDAQRLVFSNDGLIYITKDHYKSFQER